MRVFILSLLFIFSQVYVIAQIDSIGSGHAMVFDGVNDYVNLGNIYDDLMLPFTISAWVYMDADAGACPIFISQGQDSSPDYKGFWFFISPANLWIEHGDGKGGNNPAFRRGKIAVIGNLTKRWVHVCAVFKGDLDIDLYVNGINVNGSSSGDSNLPMSSNFPNEVAKIGYHVSNGNAYRFKGKIDEIRMFNKSLTEIEIRQSMTKKLTGKESGLIGYWTFDETSGNTLKDKSTNHFDGQVNGNPVREYSGAPLGDKSTYAYLSDWTGAVLSLTEGVQKIEVSNITGNPNGVHLYEVSSLPSQTQNLNLPSVSKPYFGVFAASFDSDNGFKENHYLNNIIACGTYTRNDNSVAQWNKESLPLSINSNQSEFIASLEGDIIFDLGPDQAFCDLSSYLISSALEPAGKSFLWNTGQTSPSISVTQSGIYKLTVSTDCTIKKDSIKLDFHNTPVDFSLGEDEVICSYDEKILTPINDPSGLDFTWQDGSHQTFFMANTEGTYWLKIENECGTKTDTLKLVQLKLDELFFPNVITPNGDHENQFFMLDEKLNDPYLIVYDRWGVKVFESNKYKNDWDGNGLATGVYFYRISGQCVDEKKGVLSILH
jgi:gliding motility-associated-like protein